MMQHEIPIFVTQSHSKVEINFYKFHGTGNDFIMIDDRNHSFPKSKELIGIMCDRHVGIGADGLILLRTRQGYDFEMVYFNSDGNQSTMCGNGGRCIIAFADFLSLIGEKIRFLAMDGEHQGKILGKNQDEWLVRVKMSDVGHIVTHGKDYILDTGSPHYIRSVDDVEKVDVNSIGRSVRYSELFSREGINVDFVETRDDEIFVRSYERGVEAETLSCGTGVTASSLVHAIKNDLASGIVRVRTLGGSLRVYFSRSGDGFKDIWLEGPAKKVFHGTYLT